MICKVIETIEKNELLTSVKSVAVGVSGGADSMCLLHILSSLKVKYGIIIKAVHLNHNLRGAEALRDEELVRDYCRDNDIELLLFSEDIASISQRMGVGEEECGRIVRYRCFEKAACDAVAVAHTLSDSIETTVYNFLRGTGIKGLCGIPVKREPNIIRPLINCTRQEIEKYCKDNNVPYVIDSTNFTDDYKRNFIRHNIIPQFENVNSAYEKNVSNLTRILKEESDFIELCARDLLSNAQKDGSYDLETFLTGHTAVRKRAVAIVLSEIMSKPIEFRHIDCVNNIIEKRNGKTEISKDLYVSVENNEIIIEGKINEIQPWEAVFENGRSETPFGVYKLQRVNAYTGECDAFDADRINDTLILSSRKQGDVFTFKNRGVSKSLKKLFNEMKIPTEERNKIAVLRDGKNIVWVESVGVNAPYVPDKNNSNIIKIKKEG